MAEQPKCETCRFKGWTGTQFYDCRRRAPIAINESQRRGGVTEPHWPMVEGHHWCGDHEPAADLKACATCGGSGEVRAWETIHDKPRRVVNNCPDCLAPTDDRIMAVLERFGRLDFLPFRVPGTSRSEKTQCRIFATQELADAARAIEREEAFRAATSGVRASAPAKEWNGKCVLGHCSSSGCEDQGCCRADPAFGVPPSDGGQQG